jgi:pilus assembly protein CpaF
MALMGGVELPLVALRSQLGSAVDIIVQTARLRDGKRCVTHITEVCGTDPARGFLLKDLFLRVENSRNPDGSSVTELVPTGVIPSCLEAVRAIGRDLPATMFRAASAGALATSMQGVT